MIKKKQLEIIAEKVLGVPFKYKGRDLSGLDCWGLVMYCYKELGIELYVYQAKTVKEIFQFWHDDKLKKAGMEDACDEHK